MTPTNDPANDRYHPPGNLSADFERYKFGDLEVDELFWQTNNWPPFKGPGNENIPWRKVSATEGRNLKTETNHTFSSNAIVWQRV